jgi:hypothetical protein
MGEDPRLSSAFGEVGHRILEWIEAGKHQAKLAIAKSSPREVIVVEHAQLLMSDCRRCPEDMQIRYGQQRYRRKLSFAKSRDVIVAVGPHPSLLASRPAPSGRRIGWSRVTAGRANSRAIL